MAKLATRILIIYLCISITEGWIQPITTRKYPSGPQSYLRASFPPARGTGDASRTNGDKNDNNPQPEVSSSDISGWAKQSLGNWPLTPDAAPTSSSDPSGPGDDANRFFPRPALNLQALVSLLQQEQQQQSPTSASNAKQLVDLTNQLEELTQAWGGVDRWNTTKLRQGVERRVESILTEASNIVLNPELIVQASRRVVANTPLDDTSAGTAALNLVSVAQDVLRRGYVVGDPHVVETPVLDDESSAPRPLFADYSTATEINRFGSRIVKAAEMGALTGAIYEDTLPRTGALGHTLVQQGYTRNVKWMVTDSITNMTAFAGRDASQEPFLLRTICVRGFDASDENVDREGLLNEVCTASPVILRPGVLVHGGLWDISKALYKDILSYVDYTAPQHRLVLNGHSIGGSLAIMLLFHLTLDKGTDFVRDKIMRVYSFGSPPIACLDKEAASRARSEQGEDVCGILRKLGIPTDMVHGFVQPWDPIVRLFSQYDGLYPLVGDMAEDGVTPFAGGPPRTLRPIAKAIAESWEGWPLFRDTFRETSLQNYTSVGKQHLLMPEPTRYVADRFVSINIPVPPVETILRISSRELLPALNASFPLDVFEISLLPQAIRSFVHHFYPAYGFPMVQYVKDLERQQARQRSGTPVSTPAVPVVATIPASPVISDDESIVDGLRESSQNAWDMAAQWLRSRQQ